MMATKSRRPLIDAFERRLARLSRRAPNMPGTRLLRDLLRRQFAYRHQGCDDRWVMIDDFDDNLRFRLDRSAYLGSLIYWRGFHAEDELRVLDRLIEDGMIFLDVGANQGEFTLFAAKRLPHGRVISFEPLDSLRRLLVENVNLNGFNHVLVHSCALSDETARRPIFLPAASTGAGARNEGLGTLFRTTEREMKAATVEVARLDDVVEDLRLDRVDIVKVDVEGAELRVLRGGARMLERFRPLILLEINREALAASDTTVAELAGFLNGLGYRFERVRLGGRLVPVAANMLPSFTNILCRCE